MMTPDKLKEGQVCLITHWVNQPQYVGDKLRKEQGIFIRTDKNNIETISVDMRYPYYCKVELI